MLHAAVSPKFPMLAVLLGRSNGRKADLLTLLHHDVGDRQLVAMVTTAGRVYLSGEVIYCIHYVEGNKQVSLGTA